MTKKAQKRELEKEEKMAEVPEGYNGDASDAWFYFEYLWEEEKEETL